MGHSLISAFFCDLWILLFVQPIVNNRYIDLSDLSYTAPMWQILNFHCTGARLKNHSRNLYMADGKVDISRVDAIAFDPYTHGYYRVTERVGEAFKDGMKLKK